MEVTNVTTFFLQILKVKPILKISHTFNFALCRNNLSEENKEWSPCSKSNEYLNSAEDWIFCYETLKMDGFFHSFKGKHIPKETKKD